MQYIFNANKIHFHFYYITIKSKLPEWFPIQII